MKRPLLIYGAGGLGREILSLVRSLDDWEPRGFIDDSHDKGTVIQGLEVLGGLSLLEKFTIKTYIVLAMGNPAHKRLIAGQIRNSFVDFPVLRHPASIIQNPSGVTIGKGSVICAGVVLTTDITVGDHVLINLNSTIGHDCHIGSFSSIMPSVNLAGGVKLGEETLVGSGSNVRNRIVVGEKCVIGMGSVVVRDVEPHMTVAGVPAKPLTK